MTNRNEKIEILLCENINYWIRKNIRNRVNVLRAANSRFVREGYGSFRIEILKRNGIQVYGVLKDSHCLTARGANAARVRNPKQICGLHSQHELFNPSTVSLVQLVTRGVLHRRSHTPAHHDPSCAPLFPRSPFRSAFLHTFSFISLFFKIVRLYPFEAFCRGRKIFPTDDSIRQFLIDSERNRQ